MTSIDIGALVLAAALVVGGVIVWFQPKDEFLLHPSNDDLGVSTKVVPEVISPMRARVYGTIAVLLGCGLAAGILLPKK